MEQTIVTFHNPINDVKIILNFSYNEKEQTLDYDYKTIPENFNAENNKLCLLLVKTFLDTLNNERDHTKRD